MRETELPIELREMGRSFAFLGKVEALRFLVAKDVELDAIVSFLRKDLRHRVTPSSFKHRTSVVHLLPKETSLEAYRSQRPELLTKEVLSELLAYYNEVQKLSTSKYTSLFDTIKYFAEARARDIKYLLEQKSEDETSPPPGIESVIEILSRAMLRPQISKLVWGYSLSLGYLPHELESKVVERIKGMRLPTPYILDKLDQGESKDGESLRDYNLKDLIEYYTELIKSCSIDEVALGPIISYGKSQLERAKERLFSLNSNSDC